MSLDASLTALAVGLASLWILRRLWLAVRERRVGRGCAGGCGCSATRPRGQR